VCVAECVVVCVAECVAECVAVCVPHRGAAQIEAYQSLLRKHKHSNHFALLREVCDSEPPRTTELMDR
jgi:hypothetical protein